MKEGTKLEVGDVVQLGPDISNQMFACCFMVVTEPKSFGAQGYVQCLGVGGEPGGLAFIRPQWKDMELVGKAAWVSER